MMRKASVSTSGSDADTAQNHGPAPSHSPWEANKLGLQAMEAFARTNDIRDINTAIIKLDESLSLAPPTHTESDAIRLVQLGSAYNARAVELKSLDDFDMAIKQWQDTLSINPDGHPLRLNHTIALGLAYWDRYQITKSQTDFESAVQQTLGHLGLATDSEKHYFQAIQDCYLGMIHYRNYDKFKKDQEDLEIAASRLQNALSAFSNERAICVFIYQYLGVVYEDKYAIQGDIKDIEKSIQCIRCGIDHTTRAEIAHSNLLRNLGTAYGTKYKQTGNIDDHECSVRYLKESLEQTEPDCVERTYRFYYIASTYYEKFKRSNSLGDLQLAIDNTEKSLSADQVDIYVVAHRSQTLGFQYFDRYKMTKSIVDLQLSLDAFSKSFNTKSLNDINDETSRQGHLTAAKASVLLYFDTPTSERIEPCIGLLHTALKGASNYTSQHLWILETLADMYRERYILNGAIDVFQKSLRLREEIMDNTPSDSLDYRYSLWEYGVALRTKYDATGDLADITRAIQLKEEAEAALSLRQTKGSDISRLQNLSSIHLDKFELNGNPDDLEKASRALEEALAMNSAGPKTQLVILRDLSDAYSKHYEVSGDTEFLNKAVSLDEKVLNITPPDDMHFFSRVNALASSYTDRYRRAGTILDLNRAIDLGEQALRQTQPENYMRPEWLSRLSERLRLKYMRTQTLADIERSIELGEEAITLTPKEHIRRAERLQTVSNAYGCRYQEEYYFSDLEKSVQLCQEALSATSPDQPLRAQLLFNLKAGWNDMYWETDKILYIEKAIEIGQEGVGLLPLNNPSRANLLYALGISFQMMYHRTGSSDWVSGCVKYWNEAIDHSPSHVEDRLKAGGALIGCYSGPARSSASDWEEAYNVSLKMISLLSLLTPRSLENSDKQHLLMRFANLATDSAAAALNANKAPFDAIKLLEGGRGLITRSLNELRGNISELEMRYPEMARDYTRLRDQLDAAVPLKMDKASQRHNISHDFEQLIDRIRSTPEFTQFLLPPSESDMKAAAEYGPIVIVNVTFQRSDALIVKKDQFCHLELRKLFVIDVLDRMEGDLGCPDTLAWLWECVAKPILDFLGFTQTPLDLDGEWPRIWWIPTGMLTSFPLHAAGLHTECPDEAVIDRVISSYASSIQSLIYSRRCEHKPDITPRPEKIVLIGMEHTPHNGRLQFVPSEIAQVEALFSTGNVPVVRPDPLLKHVLSALEDCNVFHFAGHGSAHPSDPLSSHLLLKDWQDHPMTVSKLLETNISQRAPLLAYLSACGSGQIRNTELMNESLHLISAYQLAGFQHVIGTLWEVNDRLCADIAYKTYTHMQSMQMSSKSVSEGLHYAVRSMRNQWLANEETRASMAAMTCRSLGSISTTVQANRDIVIEEETSSPHWVPYVHFGS